MATTTNESRVLGDATVAELAAELRGSVICPGDPGYDEARALWNAAHDRHPALIVQCAGSADVAAALRFARSEKLEVAVRGGGHSIPGFSGVDGGIVIDLSRMRGVLVDPVGKRAIVQGGATWRDVDVETQAHGLATTGGLVSTTGVGGFTLGGGIGWLMRRYGLAADNLVSADVVTADGEFVRASADENPELFWALRGGGGNFGVVTTFEFTLHEVGPTVAGGGIFYAGDDADAVLRAWREWLPSAPDELTTVVNLTTAPPAPFIPEAWHGKRVVAILGVYSGPVEEGLDALAPLRAIAEPVADLFGPIPYLAMQSLIDALHPPGDGNYFKAHHMTDMPDEAIDALVSGHRSVTSPQNEIHVHDLRGAVARGPAGGSAFPHRDAPYVLNVIAKWPGGGEGPEHVAWARDLVGSMEPFGDGSAYVNFLGDSEDTDRLRSAYGEATYDRLVAAKDRWDPENVFHLNQNVRPS
ncbi:MAG TPA: FAD-binding oxidoreductase [Thermoleophilaceae bacterium]